MRGGLARLSSSLNVKPLLQHRRYLLSRSARIWLVAQGLACLNEMTANIARNIFISYEIVMPAETRLRSGSGEHPR
jgi:hypothetical protein